MSLKRIPTVDANGKVLDKNLPVRLSDENIKEAVQDALADMLARGTHSGISFSYNDAAGSLSASVAGASGGGGTTTDTTRPTAPASFTATRTSDTSAALSWSASTDNVAVTGYRVFRANVSSGVVGSYVELTTTTPATRTYTDSTISSTNSYSYLVRAFDAAGYVSDASPVSAVGPQPATATSPSAVTNIAATSSSAQSITVTWAAPVSTGGSAITGYVISRDGTNASGTGPTTSPLQASTSRSYTFSNLVGGQTYTFSVVARNSIGDSPSTSITALAPSAQPTGPGPATLEDALFSYSSSWVETTTEHYSATAGEVASAQVTIGTGGGTISIIGTRDAHHGDLGVKIDSGAETIVGGYAAARTTGATLFTSPSLTAGTHTITIRVVGSSSTGGTGSTVALDAITTTNGTFSASNAGGGETTPPPTGGTGTTSPSTVDNALLTYAGGWQQAETEHYSSAANDTASIGITIASGGGTVTIYGTQDVHHGIMAVSVDNGAEASVDCYAAVRATTQALYTTPTLSAGAHTIKMRVTGERSQQASSTVVAIDYLSTTNGAFTTPQSPASTSDATYAFTGTWADDGTVTSSSTTSSTGQINISIAAGGGTVSVTGYKGPAQGIVGIKIDSGTEVAVDTYAASRSGATEVLWTSGNLTTGAHTLVARVTGSKNGSSSASTISISGATTTNGTFSKPNTSGAGGGSGGSTGFMTRSGTQLRLNGAQYKGVGYNTFGITGCVDGNPYSDSVMSAYYASQRANTITRTWGFKNFGIDRLATAVRQAENSGQLLLVALADGVNFCNETEGATGGGGSPKSAGWYQNGYKTGGYLDWVKTVVSRFKDSKAIAGWEYANEAIGQTGQTLYNFYNDVGNVIKNIDNNHLIWSGQRAEYDFPDGVTGFKLAHSASPVDCCSLHEYDWDYNGSRTIISGHWGAVRNAATQLNKVAYIGEVGINGATGTARVSEFQKKWSGYLNDGASYVSMWAAKRVGNGLSTYEFNFSDPLFAAQKSFAP